MATDVLGRVVEVVSGQRLDEFFAEPVFGPLGMTDTGFHATDAGRLAALYARRAATASGLRNDAFGSAALSAPTYLSGGGGLVGTAADYDRFTQMLRPGGSPAGELDGVRLLGPRTVAYMSRNHLPGDQTCDQFGRPLFAEVPFVGTGFGLGFAVTSTRCRARCPAGRRVGLGRGGQHVVLGRPGRGADRLFFTQLMPSNTYPHPVSAAAARLPGRAGLKPAAQSSPRWRSCSRKSSSASSWSGPRSSSTIISVPVQ